jgi:hypothetical protein
MQKTLRTSFVIVATVGLFGLVTENAPFNALEGSVISTAQAEVLLLPRAPRSVGGVARRTTRRVVRRTTNYVAVLPAGCEVVVVNDVSLHSCGGVYCEPYNGQYVVVVVD